MWCVLPPTFTPHFLIYKRDFMNKESKIEKLIQKQLNQEYAQESGNVGERIADKIAQFGGSWYFVIGFILFCYVWIHGNVAWVKFDPYPFILLNLFLSCLAAIQAPIILMSQNRMSSIDRKREENAYKVNLENELQIKELDKKIQILIRMIKEKDNETKYSN